MAKANGLDAGNNGVNTLMPCIFALAKHGRDPVDKWSGRTVKSFFEFKCHSETFTDKAKGVGVEHGFTGREIESLDILNNIPNLLAFTFPGKEKETTGLYLSPKICSYPVDDWQVGHIALFDALDDALHSHCIICFGQRNYFVAFRNQETKQTNTRKSIGTSRPKVWLFDGDPQHETNLTSHKDEKEMRIYIYDLLKKHNQISQQNVQVRMCGHRISLRYLMKKGAVVGQPLPSFPVPRFKTEPLLVIVMDTLVNKKCTMVDVKSTEFHSVVTAEEKLQATQKLKAMRQAKNPYDLPKVNQLITLPASVRPAPIITKSTKIPNVPQSKASVANKKGQTQTITNEAIRKGQIPTVTGRVHNKKAQNQVNTNDVNMKEQKQTGKMISQRDKDAASTLGASSAEKGKAAINKLGAKTSNTTAVKSKPTGLNPKESQMSVVLIENISAVTASSISPNSSSTAGNNDTMSLVISDVKSLAKSKETDRSRKSPSPQATENARVTRSMRRSLQPSENNEVRAVKESAAVQRRSLNVTNNQIEKKILPDRNKGRNTTDSVQVQSPESATVPTPASTINETHVNDAPDNQERHLSSCVQIAAKDILSHFTPCHAPTEEMVTSTAESYVGATAVAPPHEKEVTSTAKPVAVSAMESNTCEAQDPRSSETETVTKEVNNEMAPVSSTILQSTLPAALILPPPTTTTTTTDIVMRELQEESSVEMTEAVYTEMIADKAVDDAPSAIETSMQENGDITTDDDEVNGMERLETNDTQGKVSLPLFRPYLFDLLNYISLCGISKCGEREK